METATTPKDVVRVGATYYKQVLMPQRNGQHNQQFVPYRACALVEEGITRDELSRVPQYKAFCNVPNNLNYERNIGSFLNLSQPLEHPFANLPSEHLSFSTTTRFFHRAFGTDYSKALDYLTLVLRKPEQRLPVLVLIGPRGSGKTELLLYLTELFRGVSCLLDAQDLLSDFNSHYVYRQLIGVDEPLLGGAVRERLASLSTADRIIRQGKGLDQVEMDWFGKFVLGCTAEAAVYAAGSPFWRVRLPALTPSEFWRDLRPTLRREIPSMLSYLRDRPLAQPVAESRYWFKGHI